MMARFFRKIIVVTFLLMTGLHFAYTSSFAAEPMLSIYPASGYIKLDSTFTIDIKIDSGDNNITMARAVIVFDPEMLEIVSVEKNDALFCDWPADKQSIDKTNGVIAILGFCQSGVGNTLYKTSGESDVYARIKLKALKNGEVTIFWPWTGKDEEFKNVLMADGSPTQNVLLTKPTDVTFEITDKITGGEDTVPPDTGIFGFSVAILAAAILFSSLVVLVGGKIYASIHKKRCEKRYKTIAKL